MMLLSGLWPGLLAALALGAAAGWFSGPPRRAVPAALGLVLLALVAAALGGLVPGAAGLWVESAAMMLGAYLAGLGLGALGHRVGARQPAAGKA